MLLALALLVALPQDLDTLLERLTSGDVEVREKAEAELVARGDDAIPLLKRLEAHPDSEVRGRAKRAIEEIGRRGRVRAVRPDPVRLTLKLTDAPLQEALKKTLPPFGLKLEESAIRDDRFKERRVTLDLREATLWRALDAVEESAKVEIEADFWGVVVRNARRNEAKPSILDIGDVRLRLSLDVPAAGGDPEGEQEIRVSATLPVGSAPLGWGVEDFRLSDDQGREIPVRLDRFTEMQRSPGLRTRAGVLTQGQAWRGYVKPDPLRTAKTIRFQGNFVTKYPHDIVRHEFDVSDAKGPVTQVVNGVKCTFRVDRRKDSEAFSVQETYEGVVAGPKRKYVLWAEDEQGRWLGDLTGLVLGGPVGGRSDVGGGPHGDGKTRLAKLVLAEFVGEDRVVVPFDFKDIVQPPK